MKRFLASVVFAIPFVLPFYLLLRNAFMTQAELGALDWSWWPAHPSFQGFTDAFANTSVPLGRALLNSTIVAVVSAPVSTLLASMAGYALARIRVPAARPVFFLVIATMMVPGAATFVPTFVVVGSMGGVNTLWGLIVPGLFNAFAALGVLAFIEHWNSFLWPLVIGQDPAYWTVQVAMSTNLTSQTINMPALFASAVVSVIPLALVFLLAQRYIVRGVMMTGIKG
jgi:multiple sugar transport system permease protein